MSNGRTKPCLIACEATDQTSEDIDLIVKFSAGCFEKERNLVTEALAAMLGADLDLPVPEPFLVEIDDTFIRSIRDSELRSHIANSNRIAFGSRKLPDGFAVWPKNGRIPESLSQTAAEILMFDAIITNSDRRPDNPNCLQSGNSLGIFDHELSLMDTVGILFWRAPWADGGFDNICDPVNHIFAPCNFEVRPKALERFENAWRSLPHGRFQQYCQALPPEWGDHTSYLERTIGYLENVKNNISDVVKRGLEKLA